MLGVQKYLGKKLLGRSLRWAMFLRLENERAIALKNARVGQAGRGAVCLARRGRLAQFYLDNRWDVRKALKPEARCHVAVSGGHFIVDGGKAAGDGELKDKKG